jgi:septum formation protein
MRRLILASASPRRAELLRATGLAFEIIGSGAEEMHDHAMPPSVLCEENAAMKARDIASKHPDATVIGADTLVFLDGKALGKPADLDESRAMLRTLSGRTHLVCTAVCVIRPCLREARFHDQTQVTFRPLTGDDIETYLARVHTLDKAGAYGIQEHGELIIQGICGAYDTVMGLPVARVLEELARETDCP